MDSPELIPVIFIAYYSGYHLRTVWRVHKARLLNEEATLTRTWFSYWRDPAIAKCALRCAIRSIGVLVGIEIMEERTPQFQCTSETKTENPHLAIEHDSKATLRKETT